MGERRARPAVGQAGRPASSTSSAGHPALLRRAAAVQPRRSSRLLSFLLPPPSPLPLLPVQAAVAMAMAELGRACHDCRLRPAGDLPHRIRPPRPRRRQSCVVIVFRRRIGTTVESELTDGSVVSKLKSWAKSKADEGGLRVLEAMVRDPSQRELAVEAQASGAAAAVGSTLFAQFAKAAAMVNLCM